MATATQQRYNVGGILLPRPQSQRRQVNGAWPATLEALSDTYVDQVFQGPLG
jgi:hypothetical protein